MQFEHETYTKINTLYKRDEKKKIIIGDFSAPEFEYLFDNKWLAYEKIDGTNISVYWDGHNMEWHGKTENASIPAHLFAKLNQLATPEKLAEVFPLKYDEEGNELPMKVIIYGEGYGKKIQKAGNQYLKDDCNFRIFDAKINGWWLDMENVKDIADKLGLEMPVCYGEMTLREAEEKVRNGFVSPIAEDTSLIAEGLVLRPVLQLFNRKGQRIIVKVKYHDYKRLET